jgi:hypothetical protein
LRYTWRGWYSIVFGLRSSAAAASRVVRPPARSFYRAGRCLDYATSTPESIAAAIREVDYRPVERDGATNAARMLAELL